VVVSCERGQQGLWLCSRFLFSGARVVSGGVNFV